MSRPRGRTGLQTWLIGSFITLGVAASLLMFLVLLPTLEGSIVTGATERTSQATVGVLEDLSEVPGAGYGLTDAEGDAYVRRLASEARGAARYLDIATGWHGADLSAAPGAFPADELTPEGDLADKSFSADPVRVRVAEGPEDQRTVFSAVRVTQGGNVVGIAEVAVPVPPPTAEIGALQRRVLFAVILVLLLATVGGIVMSRILGRRIGRVARPAASLRYRWLVAGDLKLIVSTGLKTGGKQQGSGDAIEPPRLFDLKADPYELRDLASERPEDVKRLMTQLDGWWTGR